MTDLQRLSPERRAEIDRLPDAYDDYGADGIYAYHVAALLRELIAHIDAVEQERDLERTAAFMANADRKAAEARVCELEQQLSKIRLQPHYEIVPAKPKFFPDDELGEPPIKERG